MPVVFVLALFLVLNSVSGASTAGWGLAVAWICWKMPTRPGGLSIPKDLARILIVPGLMVLTALPGALFHTPQDAGKDLWYLINPIVYIAFGYLLFEQIGSWQRFMQPFLLIGLTTAVYSVYNLYTNRGLLLLSQSVESYRQIAGFGFGQAAIPIVLLLLARRSGLPSGTVDRHRYLRILLYVSGSVAIVLSLSRTIILVLLSGVVLRLRLRTVRKALLAGSGLRLLGLSALLGVGIYLFAGSSFRPGGFFVDKVLHASDEVQIQHYDTYGEINDNWRGFEAYRALRTYDTFSPREKIMGGGIGAFVDLGFAMALSPTESLRMIPTTHNGYAYLLVKTGIVGLCLFAVFLFQIWRLGWINRRSHDPIRSFVGYVLIWTAVDFAMTQAVITGIYNKAALAPNLVLLGAACCSLRRQQALGTAQSATSASAVDGAIYQAVT